ncbi:MAG: alpha-L-fucosidase [Mangrovibacterium sp.]|nr:alpha-L-fucosidase [Mangrovibacterium sp.]
MKKYKIGIFVSVISLVACVSLKAQNESVPLAPKQYRRPGNYKSENYQYSIDELKDRFSEEMMKRSAEVYNRVCKINQQGKWKPTAESIDLHKAPEWFLDAKFGMFIDWGLWSIAGWALKKGKGAMYPDWYEFRIDTDSAFKAYHVKNWGEDFKRDDFIPLFQARDYHPQKLINIAKGAGMKYVIPFSKHHGGFCLWPSSFTQRDVGEMGPKEDLIKPLVENCRKEGLKFGFYFSVEEWEYPLIGDDNNIKPRFWSYQNRTIPSLKEMEELATGKIAIRDFARDYLVPQAVEFIDRYDPDLIWYDGQWLTDVDETKTYETAAYFYNQAEGRKEVAINDRYGMKNGKDLRYERGDFFTSEFHSLKDDSKKSFHAWEECRGISQSFGFNWQDTDENVISSKAFIDMFVDIVSRGGNLLLIVNLDKQGALPDVQSKRLKDIGKWLAVNGEGIYATRPYNGHTEGSVSYTQSKDGKFVYAILKEWPGQQLTLKGLHLANGSKIEMLGYKSSLEWINSEDGIMVRFPDKLKNEKNRPCEHAWILKMKQTL